MTTEKRKIKLNEVLHLFYLFIFNKVIDSGGTKNEGKIRFKEPHKKYRLRRQFNTRGGTEPHSETCTIPSPSWPPSWPNEQELKQENRLTKDWESLSLRVVTEWGLVLFKSSTKSVFGTAVGWIVLWLVSISEGIKSLLLLYFLSHHWGPLMFFSEAIFIFKHGKREENTHRLMSLELE